MKVTRDVVETMANLAQLKVDETEMQEYVASMTRILNLVEEMDAVNTNDIEPMAHPLETVQRLRPDEVTEPDQRDAIQELAPETQDGLYLVPRIIE
ncbi:MAG: Asp-tRNA(Asn)/Glu-tRNA(Gln) amidotransferase subunit GatC [Pseudomonadales bacterium]